ncbi:MAG: nitrogen fixation protein NifA [Candidatus Brocadia sp.]|nr:Anaerobic nitric oxide reductase transcription regulator NorR [Candidatus Brocadia fulgida]MCC6325667.1 sigma 54-interacting transcriptional regulator [Candidatus Brocadia sp.]MCE7912538.1 AAA family ATPase [Candidatus Brocadia sp. AMX3]MDG5997737.1 AAA family ATPase [Candidatus Brocadia sp.]RIJ95838.1 MAG: nitrogen fixation protein NifA [Candidatus Brocadia sp.]
MIDWIKIAESHVIRTFRKISYAWWGIDIQFYDEYDACKNYRTFFQNPVCSVIHSIPKGIKLCAQTYQKELKKCRKSQTPFFYQCFAGLQGFAVPVPVQQKYVGVMIGSGIRSLKDDDPIQKRYRETLMELGFDSMELDQCYRNMKTIDQHKKEYISDFVKHVAEDVAAFYEYLQEKNETTKKRLFLLEGNYKEKYRRIIGASPAIRQVFDTLELIERSESPVLIEGESGTGKELIAAAIHYNSPCKDKTFVIQNCSAFSDTLLNSELFGHEKGSFTGAVSDKKGLFEVADKGTLFLDEIGDMNIEIQAKLLRVLEDGSFYRVGGTEQKKAKVRIIAATNRSLKGLIEQGLFRKDLFYRINTIHLTLPPLRERREDILPLANYFLDYYAIARKEPRKEIGREVRELLLVYRWPGNVRELKNLMERLILLSGASEVIEITHIPKEILADAYNGLQTHNHATPAKLSDALSTLEKNMVCDALKRARWNKTYASKELGISRSSLNNKIAEFHLRPNPTVD